MIDRWRRSCNGAEHNTHFFLLSHTWLNWPNCLYLWHRMQNLVEGGQELSPYLQWQKDMHEQDLQEELARIDRRHLEGLISHEEAVAARTRTMERNRKTARLTKEEVCHQLACNLCSVWCINIFSNPPPQLFWNVDCCYAWMCCFAYRQLN